MHCQSLQRRMRLRPSDFFQQPRKPAADLNRPVLGRNLIDPGVLWIVT
jgi:hypothetical protein